MIVGVYACFDKKASAYMAPFTLANDAMAVRAFGDSIVGSESMVAKHPEDFTLCKLGVFDDSTGQITCDQVVTLANASDFFTGVKLQMEDN